MKSKQKIVDQRPGLIEPAPGGKKGDRSFEAYIEDDVLVIEGSIRESSASYAEEDALFEAGVRSLVDMIAPTSVEVSKNYLCIDARYLCYFSLIALPRRLKAGWVEQLTRLKLPMQICFHFSPFHPHTIMKHLSTQITQIESNRT